MRDEEPAHGEPARRPRGLLRRVREHRNLAIAVVPSIFGLAWAGQRIQEVLGSTGVDDLPVRLASIGLLLAVVAFLASWFFGSDVELEAVENIGPELLVFVPRSEPVLVIAAAFGLGLLGVTSVNALAFACVLFAIKALELWSSWPLYNLVRTNTAAAEKPGIPPHLEKGIEAVHGYYLQTPWVQLTAAMMFVIAMCIAVTAFSAASPDRQVYIFGTTISSVVLIAAMAIQEAITWGWRRSYLRRLEDAAQAL